jgi:hypothetical protein
LGDGWLGWLGVRYPGAGGTAVLTLAYCGY